MEWLKLGSLSVELGILHDPLAKMMMVVVGVVASMVALYSVGYMRGERGFGRYFGLLGLFTFAMLGLVVSTNIFQMYMFWELVGASSYLLIGFYYTRPAAVAASKKAFVVTRLADLGFLTGILLLSFKTGTFDFGELNADNAALVRGSMSGSVATWAAALIFMGAAGKSAMFPLHIWLPDAMEGPTPVSALIHAATMVVAGVYLVARLFPVYYFAAPDVLVLIKWVGVFTAAFAAIIAMRQTDIKRVLAFSTISQIAYMMVALGVSEPGGEGFASGLFHLFTHAFFKALLFLGAGAVIHAVHSNEMSAMGGLGRRMPVVNITFLVACLAIAGIPPLSGFFSKDGILAAAWAADKVVFGVLLVVAGLTAFYMFRLYFRIFWGGAEIRKMNNSTLKETSHSALHSPLSMAIPLIVLAVLTCVTGFLPITQWVAGYHMHINWTIAASGIAVAVAGIAVAARKYLREPNREQALARETSDYGFWGAARRRFYIDNAWQFFAHKVIFDCVSRPIAWLDKHVVDGFFNLLGRGTHGAAEGIKHSESGRVQGYAIVFVAAVLVITLLTLL